MTTKAALYLRLSKDDGKNQASESIQNQKSFLTQWAAQNQIEITNVFCDDGFSGTNFVEVR